MIGYACNFVGDKSFKFRTLRKANITNDKLIEIISHNLNILKEIIIYNKENKIKLFRITSDLIPFGSSDYNTLDWGQVFKKEFEEIGKILKESHMRVSMHPGQYTVINSLREEVIINAFKDLEYHDKILNLLGTDKSSKIVIHIGGVYGDKEEAINRFIENYKKLKPSIKDRLIIENDDKSYNIEEVLYISEKTSAPVVYDNLHNQINPSPMEKNDLYWINKSKKTWKKEDGRQKTHFSMQGHNKKPGGHSETIYINEFKKYYEENLGEKIDIMLEVKDKNVSAIKCVNTLEKDENIKYLEKDWAMYKYIILEKSHKNYLKIRTLLKDKNSYPVLDFYNIIEETFKVDESKKDYINALNHVWGYFKTKSSEKEKNNYLRLIDGYEKEKTKGESVKNFLYKLSLKYDEKYLYKSYYFEL